MTEIELELLRDQIGKLSIKALQIDGLDHLERVEGALGPAIRHSERIARGDLRPTDAVGEEMSASIERAEKLLSECAT